MSDFAESVLLIEEKIRRMESLIRLSPPEVAERLRLDIQELRRANVAKMSSDGYRMIPVQDIDELELLPYGTLKDKQDLFVEDELSYYAWDEDAISGDVEPMDKPVGALGFWVKVQEGGSSPSAPIEIRNTGTYIQWRREGEAWQNLIAVADITGRNIELQNNGTHIQWRVVGSTTWINLVDLASLKGDAGAAVELGVQGTILRWRYVGAPDWTNLIDLATVIPQKQVFTKTDLTTYSATNPGLTYPTLMEYANLNLKTGKYKVTWSLEVQSSATNRQPVVKVDYDTTEYALDITAVPQAYAKGMWIVESGFFFVDAVEGVHSVRIRGGLYGGNGTLYLRRQHLEIAEV